MDTPLQVGILLPGDAWGGKEAQVLLLVQHLPSHGVEPHVVLLQRGETLDRFQAAGIPATVLADGQAAKARRAAYLRAWMRPLNLAVVHAHEYSGHLLFARARGAADRPALVRTHHGAQEPVRGLRWVKSVVARALVYDVTRRQTAALIAVSHDLATQLGSAIGGARVYTIHNGAPIGAAQPAVARDPHPPRIGFFGRLVPVKAVDRLLRSLPLIHQAVPAAEVWIAGTGPEEAALRALVGELGIAEHVRFLGFTEDVPAVLAQVDLVALTSRHEGLPMIALEAAVAGKPMIGPRRGGLPEVIQDGATGVLLSDTTPDAIAAACVPLLRDPTRAAALGAAARDHVARRFSPDGMAAATAAVYAGVAGPGIAVPLPETAAHP